MSDLADDQLPADPMAHARRWFDEATATRDVPNPNAMTLVTVGDDGRPSARIVLCKHFVADPGYLVWFTNYDSRKGRELAGHGVACAVLHFDHAGRQIRVEGPVVRSPADESDTYYSSRPWQSQIGARASRQSAPIDSRAELIAQTRAEAARFDLPDPVTTPLASADRPIPRPANWGGYRLWAEHIELWCDGHARLHDRARWSRALEPHAETGFVAGAWAGQRLQP
ncbi:MAG: pyridoxal 5'-phosphate synthase [Pseudomonadota bacterium]